MIWLGGAVKEPMVIDTYANQTDLAATLLYQLNLPHDSFIFSRDILVSYSVISLSACVVLMKRK